MEVITLANVSVCQLAIVLRATVAHLNQALTLWVYASVFIICLQYGAKNVVKENEEEEAV